MKSRYCLDTHVLVWYFRGKSTLSKSAKKVVEEILLGKAVGVISTMSLLESFYIGLRDKEFIFSDFLKFIEKGNIFIAPFDLVILPTCYNLPKEIDIHDRIIAATSIATGSVLVTKDKKLRSIADVKTLW